MPITNNIHWDARLKDFKGPDTTLYVEQAGAAARKCAACQGPLEQGSPLSLTVDIEQGPNYEKDLFRRYKAYVCHLSCKDPELTWKQVADGGMPEQIETFGSRFVVGIESAFGLRKFAILAFTNTNNLTIREPGAERRGALTAELLMRKFQLAPSADYAQIVTMAAEADGTVQCRASADGLISLEFDNQPMWSLDLDPQDDDTATWLETARSGEVTLISGNHLRITETEVDLEFAAASGSLVIAKIPVVWSLPRKLASRN
ncbi:MULTISPECIES: hypothetical protein [Paenarthrobacter]|uniref:Uncharacterized protein n=1 Tax=Paenarthrobacter ureafaciens TaxID=37931 RepID=A0AAX3ERL3_PAEUR|nr:MULTISPECIES: hypothetical protein [Paenarthrobacter]MDO5867113.1 hypothetical protein [Paenarthrobacter sp. SD-2]MDO5878367.1 hypothetical protein [Paenarthrobacter sp. SD-1]UYV95594.1 hypothetical protein NL395_23300 [Paenarthrobacter ureafaciens]UYW00278.1 hypothetical protein NL394_24110 [Paenarthrobacter ureafaciens]